MGDPGFTQLPVIRFLSPQQLSVFIPFASDVVAFVGVEIGHDLALRESRFRSENVPELIPAGQRPR
jgi:hypothetical protein